MLTDNAFHKLRDLIYAASRLAFNDGNRSLLESRIRMRLREMELDEVEPYLARVERDETELRSLIDLVTTNLTRFFRNAAHVATFRDVVILRLAAHKQQARQRVVRAWSAGCSTGEEPFTIAMMLAEHLPAGLEYEVVGSDISLKSAIPATSGFYPQRRVEGVEEPYLSKYFDKKRDGFQVAVAITKAVRFAYSNLMHDSGLRDVDVIFCRNVLIYFDAVSQRQVVSRLHLASKAPGYLFIGHSESLFAWQLSTGTSGPSAPLSTRRCPMTSSEPVPLRVVVVDDSQLMRRVVRRMLERDTTLQVVGEAANGAQGLEQAATLSPDVVVLDIEMPVLNGIEFLKQRERRGWRVARHHSVQQGQARRPRHHGGVVAGRCRLSPQA